MSLLELLIAAKNDVDLETQYTYVPAFSGIQRPNPILKRKTTPNHMAQAYLTVEVLVYL